MVTVIHSTSKSFLKTECGESLLDAKYWKACNELDTAIEARGVNTILCSSCWDIYEKICRWD